jgi:hypothetical protein
MAERLQEQGMVVLERLSLAHIAGQALAAAPGTQDLHLDASS